MALVQKHHHGPEFVHHLFAANGEVLLSTAGANLRQISVAVIWICETQITQRLNSFPFFPKIGVLFFQCYFTSKSMKLYLLASATVDAANIASFGEVTGCDLPETSTFGFDSQKFMEL